MFKQIFAIRAGMLIPMDVVEMDDGIKLLRDPRVEPASVPFEVERPHLVDIAGDDTNVNPVKVAGVGGTDLLDGARGHQKASVRSQAEEFPVSFERVTRLTYGVAGENPGPQKLNVNYTEESNLICPQ